MDGWTLLYIRSHAAGAGKGSKRERKGGGGEEERDREREKERERERKEAQGTQKPGLRSGIWLPLHSLDSSKRKVQVRVKGWGSGFYFFMGGTTEPHCGGARSM